MLITTQTELQAFCEKMATQEFITVDTEFLREKTYYPKLCLIQIAGPDGTAAAIDPIEGKLDLRPVFDLLQEPKILKIFHAARQDLEIFHKLTGKVVHPFFDTQIAAMVCGYGDSVGYENLVRNITGRELDKSAQYTDWSRRPLSQKQIDYALGDVIYLVEIYQKLARQLAKQNRTSWVFEEEKNLADPVLYENPPDLAWQRIKLRSPRPKTLAVLRSVAAWREKRAQEKDLPRSWVMRDETLADLASQAPTSLQKLKRIRNMPDELTKGALGENLVALIEGALGSDPAGWPPVEKKKPLPPSAAATVDILRMLLKVQCTEHGVAAKLVASAEDLEEIALKANPETPALHGWRYEVFGRDALALKKGALAIGLKGSRICKFRVDAQSEIHE